MPIIKSALVLTKEFTEINLPDCSAKDRLAIKVRQANEGLRIQRESLIITPIRRQLTQEGEFREEQVLAGYRYQMAVEVYLTLAGCNVETAARERLLEFNGDGQYRGSFEEFIGAWGQIFHPEWISWIHERVLEVNPKWGLTLPALSGESDVALSEGEALPAEAAG